MDIKITDFYGPSIQLFICETGNTSRIWFFIIEVNKMVGVRILSVY